MSRKAIAPQMEQGRQAATDRAWLDDFAQPPADFRPISFWSWNEKMDPAEVRRQLEIFVDAGYGGVFLHSRIGLLTLYLSEAWFEAVDAAVAHSARLGLKVWLYDEDTWPSGFSGGSVPRANPDYRTTALFAAAEDAPVPDGSIPIGKKHHGVQCYLYTEPLGNPRFNGTTYINPLHRSAVAKFIEDAYQTYHRRYGKHYGRLIPAAFTDEPSPFSLASLLPNGAVPYAPELPRRFQEMHGDDPTERLHLLFCDGPGAAAFRLAYYRSVNDLFEQNFTRQIADWCDRHGIALTGHYIHEGNLVLQQKTGALVMRQHQHMHIPGIDHLGRQIAERITAKQCQSVVNQLGKTRMLSELYGASGQNLSFADRLWIAKQQIALGVNLLVPHLALYTMAGCRKRDYPPNLFFQQPWWPAERPMADELSRLCVAMAQGRYAADTLVLHPGESVFTVWKSSTHDLGKQTQRVVHQATPTESTSRDVAEIEKRLVAITDALLAAGLGFDFGEENILAEHGKVITAKGARLRVGRMDYAVVVLPHMHTINRTTFRLLREFEQAGGTIVRCGMAPQLLDGGPSAELAAWGDTLTELQPDQLPQAVIAAAPPTVMLRAAAGDTAGLVYLHVRKLDEGDRIVFAVNLHRAAHCDADLIITKPCGAVRLLDTATGQIQTVNIDATSSDCVSCPVRLHPLQHVLLYIEAHANNVSTASSTVSLAPPTITRTVRLDLGRVRVQRLDDNAMTLDYAAWREAQGDWSPRPLPVIAIQERLNRMGYDGPLALRFPLRVGRLDPARKLHLVVEHPDRYRIRVNSQQVAYNGLPPWRDPRWLPIDITGLLKQGDNSIELYCPDFRHGDPACYGDPAARYGTEIESIYLVGDFAVNGTFHETPHADPRSDMSPQPTRWMQRDSLILSDPIPLVPGDVLSQGLPFYAGRLRVSIPLDLPADMAARAALCLERFDAAVVEAAIDQQPLGHIMIPAATLPMPTVIGSNRNKLHLTFYSTLRNLLGPHHHPGGESSWVSPLSFSPWPYYAGHPRMPDVVEETAAWAAQGSAPKSWRDDYCFVPFGSFLRH